MVGGGVISDAPSFWMPEMSCFISGVSLLMLSHSIVVVIGGGTWQGVLPHPHL